MTTTAVPATPTAPAQKPLTAKGRRAWEFLAEHMRRIAEKWGGLREYRCGDCGRVLFEYVPPIRLVAEKCRWCGSWQTFSTEPVTR